MKKSQFVALLAALFATPAFIAATPVQRLTYLEDTFRNVPVLWDYLKNLGLAALQELWTGLETFAGPAIPEKPVEDWFSDWWLETFGWAYPWTPESEVGL